MVGGIDMMEEIRQTVYIAVSAILLSIVLTFASVVISIESDLATVRNDELAANQALEQARKFNKYDNKIISGDDVIELIRMYYDSGIEIYIDTFDGTSGPIRINSQTVRVNPSLVSLSYLQSKFTPSKQFLAQIVYNAVDPAIVASPMINKPVGSEVTGISLRWISN